MIDREKDILIITSQKFNSTKLLISHKTNLIISSIEYNKDTKSITVTPDSTSIISFPDDILSIHHLSSINKILISCVSNKSLYLLEEKIIYENKKFLAEFNPEKDGLIFQNNKKMTAILDIKENEEKYFLIISDKFGEISLKPIKKEESKESFEKEIKIVTGHCDTIVYLKKTINDKLLLSSDNFGKIKIYDFPNIFNVISVILYHENEIKYVNFGGKEDKCIFVINKDGNIDLWSTYDFIMKNKIKMDFLINGEKILEVKCLNKNEILMMKTDKKIILLKINDEKYEINMIKEIEKEKNKDNNNGDKENKIEEKLEDKFFDYEGNTHHLLLNTDDHTIQKINLII